MRLLIFSELFLVLIILLLVGYLIRHLIFTYTVLFKERVHPGYMTHAGDYQPTVTMLIPAKNEERVIGQLLHRITQFTYPKEKLEVIVINDGSTDSTGEVVERYSAAHPYIHVLNRQNGNVKAGALNEALGYAKNEIIACFDADYYPQRDIIEKLTSSFIDPEVGIVQGRVTVLNEGSTIVTRLVTLERIAGYKVDQQGRDELGLIPQYGGTVGAIRKSLLKQTNGWDTKILAEDTDLTFSALLLGYKIRYVEEAECYEEAVETWGAYIHQRERWAQGHMAAAVKHFFPMWKSGYLSFKEKLDGSFLLLIYFLPFLIGLGWFIGLLTFPFYEGSAFWYTYYLVYFSFMFSSVGNFAPFFEVGAAAYLDRRSRMFWMVPFLFVAYVVNVYISTKAFFLLILNHPSGKTPEWKKTYHNGNSYDGSGLGI